MPAATYLPGLATADSSSESVWQAGNALKQRAGSELERWRGNVHSALDPKIGLDTERWRSRSQRSRWVEGPREGSEFPYAGVGVGSNLVAGSPDPAVQPSRSEAANALPAPS